MPVPASAKMAAAVTTSDSATFAPTYGLYVGGAGNVKVDMYDGGTVTFNSVTAGTILPIKATRVYATGTTATNIVALY